VKVTLHRFPTPAIRAEYNRVLRGCRARRIRTLEQFFADEIVIPEGQYKGRKYRVERTPYARHIFRAIDSGRWTRFAGLGCVQGGKSFHFFVGPIIYHLFEHGESVVVGIPQMDMAYSKWAKEIRPVILRTRYRELMPAVGQGSRGGKFDEIEFKNGATLRFMSGHGGDEKRSSFTARVVVCTEVDKMDRSAASSREADPITQLEARTLSYDLEARRIYLENTVSISEGRIWREYTTGTESRIVCPCPHCGAWVTPEREHLRGWREAETDVDAYEAAYFVCPDCEAPITADQRRQMNLDSKLLHKGQEIDPSGAIHGEPVKTWTLGFRWNGFNNLFWSAGSIGVKEWKGERSEDPDNAEKESRQFLWALPYDPPIVDVTALHARTVRQRVGLETKGFVPADTDLLTLGVDIGKYVSWWLLTAWGWEGCERPWGHIVDYGSLEVPSQDQDVEVAILAALRTFRDEFVEQGWATPDGAKRVPNLTAVDARYKPQAIHQFLRESGDHYIAAHGCGRGKRYPKAYSAPRRTTKSTCRVGLGYHVDWAPIEQLFMLEIDADYNKGWIHERLATPVGQPGAITLYKSPDVNEHTTLAKHLTAEKQVEEFVPGQGTVLRWEVLSRRNHWLDCLVYAVGAAFMLGMQSGSEPAGVEAIDAEPSGLVMPDGRPYLVTERRS